MAADSSSSKAGWPAEEGRTGGSPTQLFPLFLAAAAGPLAFWRRLGPLAPAAAVAALLPGLAVGAWLLAADVWDAGTQYYAELMEYKIQLAWDADRVSWAPRSLQDMSCV